MKDLFKGFFKFNKGSTSYAPPIIKSAVSFSVIVSLLILRFNLLRSQNQPLDTLIGIAVAAVFILGMLRIYISIAEIIAVHDNICRKSDGQYKEFPLSDVLLLIERNDIIELSVLLPGNNKTYRIGSSSINKRGNSVFYAKRYYIADSEFSDIASFKCKIADIYKEGNIKVISIDGVSPDLYKV